MRWLAITYAITLTTAPVVVTPCGLDAAGLPFGLSYSDVDAAAHYINDLLRSER